MKLFNNHISILLLYGIALLYNCSKDPGGSVIDDGNNNSSEFPGSEGLNFIFKKAMENYTCYRIPALLRVDSNTLLAFAEGRKNSCSDTGNIDLIVKRSEDNGFTWSSNIVVWSDADNTCGNPAPIWDDKTGKVILLSTWNNGSDDLSKIVNGSSIDTRRVFVLTSSDKGKSWSMPKEITSTVKQNNWRWYATGPGSGITIKNGTYKGRLVVGCDFIDNNHNGFSHIIYSDDHGTTWSLGGVVPESKTNECEVAELSNNNLMLNMRNSGTEHRRKIATSSDGGINWTYLGVDNTLISPTVQASLHRFSFTSNILLFSNPSDTDERKNMTIRLSKNDGLTWTGSLLLNNGFAAYSDLENYNENRVAILYEAGETTNDRYQGISFETFDISKIN